MTTPFSRSIRILDADRFRPSVLIIALAVVILLVWLIWLVFARVTILENGRVLTISPVGEIQAQFSNNHAQKIRIGQSGLLELDDEAGELLGQIPVIVTRRYSPVGGNTQVDLLIIDERFYTVPPDERSSGQVRIEVDRLSPLTLFLRASGQFVGAPRVSTSPQQTSQP